MSLEVFLQRFGSTADAPMPDATQAAIARIVQTYGGPERRGQFGYFFDMPGDVSVAFYVGPDSDDELGPIPNSGMLELRDFSPRLAAFLFDVMSATCWYALVPGENINALSTGPFDELKDGVGNDIEKFELVSVSSADDVVGFFKKYATPADDGDDE